MNTINDRYIAPPKAAKLVDRSVVTLERWRRLRIGPPFYRVCGRVLYDPSEIEEWIASQRQAPGDAA